MRVNPMFHAISGGAALVVVFLMVLQFYLKKGTDGHIFRAYSIGTLVLAIIVGNTWYVSRVRGLNWDAGFLHHTGLGVLFFVAYIKTLIEGHRLLHGERRNLFRHGIAAFFSALFLAASLLFAVAIAFSR